jgi:hypothetical protein
MYHNEKLLLPMEVYTKENILNKLIESCLSFDAKLFKPYFQSEIVITDAPDKKRFYWFLFAVCLLSRRFRLKGKTPWDYGWEMAWNFFINAIFRLGIFCNSRWRLLILKGCPLRESIIGAAAGGIGHPRLAIGI